MLPRVLLEVARCEPSERLDETRNLLDVGIRLRQLAEVSNVKSQVAKGKTVGGSKSPDITGDRLSGKRSDGDRKRDRPDHSPGPSSS